MTGKSWLDDERPFLDEDDGEDDLEYDDEILDLSDEMRAIHIAVAREAAATIDSQHWQAPDLGEDDDTNGKERE